MANSSITLSSLDFDTLKENFKTYLKTQSTFKDYNFDGSNISVLLDVMAYNSYLNSYYLNMVASEMFLDSALKYDSVISHAKELNYVPRSAHASMANVAFTVETTGIDKRFTVPKGTRFSGINSNGTFTFVTDQSITFVSSNSTFNINNLQINEGDYFQDSFTIDYDVDNPRYVLSNENIDIATIQVNVVENNGASNTIFQRVSTLFQLNDKSEVYFLQGVEGGKYEIVFGDGLFGRLPLDGSTVIVSYIVTSGTDGNGVDNFVLLDDLGTLNGGVASASEITVLVSSTNGANQESIESVRFAAPRYFASQQRAVTVDDYASLVKTEFGGEIDDIIVYGGQDLQPKQYGRVVVSVKPSASVIAPDYLKTRITDYLQPYIALPNRVLISDPDYFYLNVVTTIQFNSRLTTKFAAEIESLVLNGILDFSADHLEKFGNDFRYSRFVTHIDDLDSSITSNDTYVRIAKRISPKLLYATSYDINFNNGAEQEGLYEGVAYPDERVLNSSSFTYVDEGGNLWPLSYIEDNPARSLTQPDFGDIEVYTYSQGKKFILKNSIGYIQYSTGRVVLSNLVVSDYMGYISIFLSPKNKDIIANKNQIILTDPNDVSINVIETVR